MIKTNLIYLVLSFLFSVNLCIGQSCPDIDNLNQKFCSAEEPTVGDLLPTGVVWYSSADPSESPLPSGVPLLDQEVYFAGNLNGECGNRPEVTVNLYQHPDAGSDKQAYLCGTSNGIFFNNLTEERKFLTDMLDPWVPKNGTFNPTIMEINKEFRSSPLEGFKNLTTIYTVGEFGCTDSVELTVTVYEYVNAGIGGEVALTDSSPVNLFQFLGGSPSAGGTWSGLEGGVFDPLSDQEGAYTYSVGNPGCVVSSTLVVSYTGINDEINCEGLITENELGVGIGVDNPDGSGLSVGGSIYTDEVRVMNVDTWPDYVFSESYSPMELEDVASYIQQYAHLPGLPSAKEVFDDGISLTQMDKANLKKLEELSLYLLDQHARMKRLRSSKGEKAFVLSNRSDKEKANDFVFEQFRMKEGQGQLMTLPTDSLSIRNMYCQGDNVGINTSDTGGYRLGVTGGILSEGVKVESVSNWPDYVFYADYSLRSLDELEVYIEANRHLPGLPSAKAIESEGYSLSEMDRLLMEKVEELTLYIIDQERHLTDLSKELGIDFPTKSHKWPGTSENLLAENSGSHYKDYTKKEVQILAEVSGTFTSPLCDAISCNGEEVGIGTDPLEGYRLAVAGGILTDDIRVASVSNWPDYVFEPNYKLRDLTDLSNYIESKGHLPGVPKAEVFEQEGYRLETMDALLLEKIEELTLYLIGQERLLTFLKKRSIFKHLI